MSALYVGKDTYYKVYNYVDTERRNLTMNVYIKFQPSSLFPTGLTQEGLDLLSEVADFVANDSGAMNLKTRNGDIAGFLVYVRPFLPCF